MNRADVLARTWFHAMDLGDGVVTEHRLGPDVPPNYTLYGFFDLVRHIDLSEARCFDLGTMDGICAFLLKRLGARQVVACDMSRRPTFELARERLGLDVEYKTPVPALTLPSMVGPERADLVLLNGIIYHVYDPLTVLVACRQSLRREGLLFVETAFLFDEGRPSMSFNLSELTPNRIGTPQVYWRPSKAAVHGMLQLAGFEILATRAVHGRLTVLAQAKRPSAIAQRDEWIAIAQDHRDRHFREADFDALENDDAPPARIRYDGPRDDRFIYRAHFTTDLPLQPAWQPRSEAIRWRDAARSARMHAAMRLAEARTQAAPKAKRVLRRALARLRTNGATPSDAT